MRLFNINNHELMERILKHQSEAIDGKLHPLTCGHDSEHWVWPKIIDDVVVLKCNRCSYTQYEIPKVFTNKQGEPDGT